MQTMLELLRALTPDDWRKKVGFSSELIEANSELYKAGNENDIRRVLNRWLSVYQPCLFGRYAAKNDRLSWCILDESDLVDDSNVRERIQSSRLGWTRAGFRGESSAFLVYVRSRSIAEAVPDAVMATLASRLCSLYLLTGQDTDLDRIYHDEIWLEMPGYKSTTWKWLAGVNYFCAQGDGRWWRDHRIPGGLAFSVNSVGHMVKSGSLANIMDDLQELMGAPEEGWEASKVDSLKQALRLAMQTIKSASDGVSGRATSLRPLPEDLNQLPVSKCPVDLPPDLRGMDFCEYSGYYHTDQTLPSLYFKPDVSRPESVPSVTLDFTYMFDQRVANPDHITMFEGRRVRNTGDRSASYATPDKLARAEPEVVDIDDEPQLKRALKG